MQECKRQGRQRAKFFEDARGSAFECAAGLEASVAKRFTSGERVRPGKEMLARIVSMLTRLIDRFDGSACSSGPKPLTHRSVSMYFVPEGRCDRSQARSAWDSASPKGRPVGYGVIRTGVRTDSMIGMSKFRTFRKEY
jgi:hypothetical protein